MLKVCLADSHMIIFDHPDFLICHKPLGVNVHHDPENPKDISFLRQMIQASHHEKLWLVHRLDKATSGLMILACNSNAASVFGTLFQERRVEKTYLALSSHKPSKKQGLVVGDMTKARRGSWKLLRSKLNPAVTRFFSCSYSIKSHSLRLFYLRPKTGKSHQLRVALKSIGAAIDGDERYGGEKADRLYLHAYNLAFLYEDKHFSFSTYPADSVLFDESSLATCIKTIESKNATPHG